MKNVKFKGLFALFAADAKKNQTILSSIVFTNGSIYSASNRKYVNPL